ncbi:MAG TPA: T9SS type A sorting domain-containing protein [Chitinophagaceae bacterium]|jgi:plastocyanin
MKAPILLLPVIFLNALAAKATVHEVHVADFHFDPAQFDAIVGDTVLWTLDNGTHTTTGTTVNIPAGADTWDAPIDASNTSFQYVIKVPGSYFYFSKVDGDMSGSFDATGTLPVQLINFSLAATANNNVLLSWNTASEQNTSYFSVKRSADAKNFGEIAKVKAAGNSSVLHFYNYTDNEPGNQNKFLYYQIEVVDNNGAEQFSDIKTFKNNLAKPKLILALNPNPVSKASHVNVQFNADSKAKMFVQIFNTEGKLIKQTSLESVEGINNTYIDLNNISSGIYKIKFSLNGATETKTLIVR